MSVISYDELRNRGIKLLEYDDDVLVEMVDELDSYNGFADGFKCYPMYMLDDMSLSDFLNNLTPDFDHNSDYFCETIYGIGSVDDVADYYRDNISLDDVLDALVDTYPHIYFSNSEFEEIVEALDYKAEFYDEDTLEPIEEDKD